MEKEITKAIGEGKQGSSSTFSMPFILGRAKKLILLIHGKRFVCAIEIEENCYFLARGELLQSSLSHRKAVIANMAFGLSKQVPSKTLFVSSCLGTAAFKFNANGFQPQKTSNFIFHSNFLLSLRCCLDDEPFFIAKNVSNGQGISEPSKRCKKQNRRHIAEGPRPFRPS